MAQLASAAIGKPGTEDLLLASQADTEGWYGKLKNAHELTRRAMDSAEHNDAKESAASYQATAALREVESGNREQARADANAALKLAPNHDVRVVAALALARAGDTAGAEKLATELGKTYPMDTLVQRNWLPTIRAAIALEREDPNRAIDFLKDANAIELGQATSALSIFLCPVYIRGEAYLMLHDGTASGSGVSEVYRPSGNRGEFSLGSTGAVATGPRLRSARRHRQSQGGLSGVPHNLERRRPGHSDPQAGQERIREAAIDCTCDLCFVTDVGEA